MWRIPLSLIAGDTGTIVEINSDTLIGNLWTYLGSPTGPQVVQITVDGADVGDVQITADWSGGSTFDFICVNGGRIVGLGGNGGDGGDDFGASGSHGSAGDDAGHALTSDGFTVNVDIDDGFLLGGGGGGGGASYDDTGAGGDAGGGGGGGSGFSVTDGGLKGTNIGVPAATDGGDGGPSGPGTGGIGGGTGLLTAGDGGNWGSGGQPGDSDTTTYRGGAGGTAGSAFFPTNGASIVYSGAKSEATLITENRLIGQTGAGFAHLAASISNGTLSSGLTEQYGWSFFENGTLQFDDSTKADTSYTAYWYDGSGVSTGADYEVRTVIIFGAGWSTAAAGTGVWTDISVTRTWEISDTGPDQNQTLFELRLAGSSDILASGWLTASHAGP
jgi:hypothetical protein